MPMNRMKALTLLLLFAALAVQTGSAAASPDFERMALSLPPAAARWEVERAFLAAFAQRDWTRLTQIAAHRPIWSAAWLERLLRRRAHYALGAEDAKAFRDVLRQDRSPSRNALLTLWYSTVRGPERTGLLMDFVAGRGARDRRWLAELGPAETARVALAHPWNPRERQRLLAGRRRLPGNLPRLLPRLMAFRRPFEATLATRLMYSNFAAIAEPVLMVFEAAYRTALDQGIPLEALRALDREVNDLWRLVRGVDGALYETFRGGAPDLLLFTLMPVVDEAVFYGRVGQLGAWAEAADDWLVVLKFFAAAGEHLCRLVEDYQDISLYHQWLAKMARAVLQTRDETEAARRQRLLWKALLWPGSIESLGALVADLCESLAMPAFRKQAAQSPAAGMRGVAFGDRAAALVYDWNRAHPDQPLSFVRVLEGDPADSNAMEFLKTHLEPLRQRAELLKAWQRRLSPARRFA
jgi:hypothetical protein